MSFSCLLSVPWLHQYALPALASLTCDLHCHTFCPHMKEHHLNSALDLQSWPKLHHRLYLFPLQLLSYCSKSPGLPWTKPPVPFLSLDGGETATITTLHHSSSSGQSSKPRCELKWGCWIHKWLGVDGGPRWGQSGWARPIGALGVLAYTKIVKDWKNSIKNNNNNKKLLLESFWRGYFKMRTSSPGKI